MFRMLCLVMVVFAIDGLLPAAVTEKPSTVLDEFLKNVKRTTLSNGMTLITCEKKGSGVVAINTWVKVGYFHEPDEVAGMAHLFEHMFFKGSTKFPGAEQISQELAGVGGQSNAGTIYDSTNYYFVVPTGGFLRAMEIQSDAMINPLFNSDELKKEAEVVIEESNRKLDNPPAVSMERMFAVSFTHHRMKRWRIGSNEVLRNINRDNLIAFFETVYRPENMILTIAGDVSHHEAIRVAKETFEKHLKGKPDKKHGPKEPPQTEFRFDLSEADIKQGYSVLGWHTVGVGNQDELTLNVLAMILGQGRSSRLFVNVVNPQGAATVEASHETFEDVGILAVQASFDEKNRATVESGILSEIERMKAHGSTDYELQLAKNKMESSFLFGLQDVLGQAQALSQFEARHGYEAMRQQLLKLKSLTGPQIRDAARRYLTIENLTLYQYTPLGTSQMSREQALDFVRKASASVPEAIAETPLPSSSHAVRKAAPGAALRQEKLSNGMTLIVHERHGLPAVSAGVYFKGGRIDENSANAGITQLLARTMRKGTSSRSGKQIDRQIEYLGTQINPDVQEDYFGMNLSISGNNFKAGFELLADVILNPVFPVEGLEEERFQQVAAIKRSLDSSLQRPFQLANEALYGNHPYALPPPGYQTSLAGITQEQLREWWKKRVVSDDGVILIAGDIAIEEAKALAEQYFGNSAESGAPRQALPSPVMPSSRMEIVEYRERKQSGIALAFPSVIRTNPDWPVIRLLGNVTSGLAGTFFAEIRGKQALAYTVFARDSSRVEHGTFIAYLATEASKEPLAREALLKEIRRLATDGITQQDVDRAKSSFAGSTIINLQTNEAILLNLASHHFFGVGLDFMERLLKTTSEITLEQLRDVARKYLSGDVFVSGIQRGKS